jgi:hypothetical protein
MIFKSTDERQALRKEARNKEQCSKIKDFSTGYRLQHSVDFSVYLYWFKGTWSRDRIKNFRQK